MCRDEKNFNKKSQHFPVYAMKTIEIYENRLISLMKRDQRISMTNTEINIKRNELVGELYVKKELEKKIKNSRLIQEL